MRSSRRQPNFKNWLAVKTHVCEWGVCVENLSVAMPRVMSRRTLEAFFMLNCISSRSSITRSICFVCPCSVSAVFVPTYPTWPLMCMVPYLVLPPPYVEFVIARPMNSNALHMENRQTGDSRPQVASKRFLQKHFFWRMVSHSEICRK